MRGGMRMIMALALAWPVIALASVPQQIAPQGGFLPLRQHGSPHLTGMPAQARFMPLPARSEARMLPLKAPAAPALPAMVAPAETPLPAGKVSASTLTEDDAKLLLSIFTAGY